MCPDFYFEMLIRLLIEIFLRPFEIKLNNGGNCDGQKAKIGTDMDREI